MTPTSTGAPARTAALRVPAAFAALLLVLFIGAYATGGALGPVAPGLHPGPGSPATVDGGDGHGHGAAR